MEQDYYKLLGVERSATDKELKSAFRKLARTYHPDVNPDDPKAEAQFKAINQAYDVLSDKEKREKYDRFGTNWQRYEQTGAPWSDGGGRAGRGGADDADFSDLFDTLFGGRSGGAGGQVRLPGQDVEQPVTITLQEADSGTERVLQFQTASGQPRTLTVKIPRGVDTGAKVRVAGEGGPGYGGGPRGDLYLVVTVEPHPRFERRSDDLHTTVPVDLYTLLLGGEARLTMLNGKTVTLKVPEGTQNGKTMRLSGQGMARRRTPGSTGDLYVRLEAQLPTTLSERERELVNELRGLRE